MEENNKKGLMAFWRSLAPFRKSVTQEDIESVIDSGQETGLITEEENEMIHRIFEMKDIVVREVMVPRTDIKALDASCAVDALARLVVEAGHSRVPVFEGAIDKIVGIVYAKDLLKYWGAKGEGVKVKDVMRAPLFVPETKSISNLFSELKEKRVHIAIVVDEYGGTSGIVTIEDLLEEIVGDIQDEYDSEEEEFIPDGENEYIVHARMDIDELAEKLDVIIEKEDYDTLGGFIAHLCNRIPSVNEEIVKNNLKFTIVEADERKVSKVRVKVTPIIDGEEPDPESSDE